MFSFFFSSRRRHTRWPRDWSSDVCSSDLPFGEWNQAEILVHRGTVVHFQNGEAVLEYEIGTEEWNEMVANSKFAGMEEFATNETGYIALQDHSDDVWFRNIKDRKSTRLNSSHVAISYAVFCLKKKKDEK